MTTEKQVRANRENALRSTGPRSHQGKAASRMNAVKHGILAEHVVLPTEDPREFAAFKNRIHEELDPVGELEDLQADLVAAYAWRLRRVMQVEKGILTCQVYEPRVKKAERTASAFVEYPNSSDHRMMELVAEDRGEAVIADPAGHQAALEKLEELRAIRNGNDAMLGEAFLTDASGADSLSKLSRYEAHIQRSLFRTLDELHRLQAARLQAGDAEATPTRQELAS